MLKITFLALLLLFSTSVALAQDTGYIGGTVTDKSGAAVSGANVLLRDVTGNITRNTVTNNDGAYVISGLPGATYDLVVTATGFQKFTAQKVVLQVAEKARIDVQLTVGTITEEVIVTGESVAQVETSSSEISSTITGKQIDNLVLNGRNFTQLVTLSPGVVNQTGQDEGTVGVYGNVAYAINGGRTEYNNWELDGGDNMDNGSNSTLNVYPNPEAIAEFKVLTSSYGAQYGRNGSGTIEVETKSGGSSFHGSAFEYLRNDFFNANQYFNKASSPELDRPSYKKHDFGYTIGGPVYIPHHYNSDKKKTFFFFSEEWRREQNPSTIAPQNVPSDAERGLVGGAQTGFGNFSDLCPGPDCPNVANPSAVPISAVGQALLALIPQANTTNGGFPAFVQTVSTPTHWREELIRIDHNITDNYRLTFRYIHDSWGTVVPNPLWGAGTSDFQNIQTNFVGPGTSFVARLNANITPTLLNEFVASYTADHIFLTALNNPPLPSPFPMGAIFNNGFGGKLPAINLSGNTAYDGGANGVLAQDTGYFPWTNANPTYTYRDNVTKILGTHTFQFGAYVAFAQKNEENSPDVQGILSFTTSSAFSTGNTFADLLLGNIASYKQWNTIAKYYNRYKIVEPYFQDDWRVTKNLTLNLGLRVSLFGTYRERYQQAYNLDYAAFNPANAPVYDVDGSITGSAGSFIPGMGNPLNGVVQCGGPGGPATLPGFGTVNVGGNKYDGCLKGHLFNPAPRIGFAWDPKGDGKLAVRGGYGIFYEHTNGNEGNTESLEGSAPLVLTSTQSNINGYGNIGGSGSQLPFFPLTLVSIPDKAIWPYVQQWNLGVQKELPSHLFLSVAYVGSKGTHLTLLSDGNQIVPLAAADNPYAPGEAISQPVAGSSSSPDCGTTFLPNGVPTNAKTPSGVPITGQAAINLAVAACGATADLFRTGFPGYSSISQLRNEANSVYHALQVQAHRTVGDLTLSVAYTYSHSIDDSSDRSDSAFVNAYNFAANRASSNFDLRHSFQVSYVYGLPFFKHAGGVEQAVLGGWQVSGITIAQTGTPFSVTNGTNFGDNAGVGNGFGTGSRPDIVADPRSGFSSSQDPTVSGPLWYNPAAYAIPTGLTFGNVGRNTLNLPGRLNFDVGVFKRFAITERYGFDFRWENFNFFNHTQFNGIDSTLGDSGFLHVNSAHFPRIMQFGLRFYF